MPLGIGMTPEKYVEIAYSKAPTLLTTASDLPSPCRPALGAFT